MNRPFDQKANPEKYGLVECPHCHGYGSSLKEAAALCTQCDGSGLVTKKESDTYKDTNMNHRVNGEVNACCHRVIWWIGGDEEISEALTKEMAEAAEDRAKVCIVDGCNQGELNFIDSHTEHEYTGWWKISDEHS